MVYDEFPSEFTVRWGRFERVLLMLGIVGSAGTVVSLVLLYEFSFRWHETSNVGMMAPLICTAAALVLGCGALAVASQLYSWHSELIESKRKEVAAMEFDANADGILIIIERMLGERIVPGIDDTDSVIPLAQFPSPAVKRVRTVRWVWRQWQRVRAELREREVSEDGFERARFDVLSGVRNTWRDNRGQRHVLPGKALKLTREDAIRTAVRSIGVKV